MTRDLLRRSLIWSAALFLFVGASAVAGQSPASAHANVIGHGSDYARINTSHDEGYVCDIENDGNRVFVHILTREGAGLVFWDRLSDGTCAPFEIGAGNLSTWRLCEDNGSCTSFEPI
jgi:hypothetical protein